MNEIQPIETTETPAANSIEANVLERLLAMAVEAGKDANSVLTEANVRACVHSHYVNAKGNGSEGVACLIAEILIDGSAYAAPGSENVSFPDGTDANSSQAKELRKDHRETFAKICFTSDEIHKGIVARYSGTSARYPKQSVRTILSNMVRRGLLVSWRLESDEDANRQCKTTHCLYYLSTTPPPAPKRRQGFAPAKLPTPPTA